MITVQGVHINVWKHEIILLCWNKTNTKVMRCTCIDIIFCDKYFKNPILKKDIWQNEFGSTLTVICFIKMHFKR